MKRYKQENSQQIKQFLKEIRNDFDVTYVDNLASQGVPWGDTLLETLCDLGVDSEYKDVFIKMQSLPLSQKDLTLLKKALTVRVQKYHSGFSEKKEVLTNEIVDKVETSSKSPLVAPDLLIAPNKEMTWLNKIGEELEEWATCDNDIMSHKPTREAWTEAVKIKRNIEKEIAKIAAYQETVLEKQNLVGDKIQRLSEMVQEIKDHLQKKIEKKGNTQPLRDEIKYELYQGLMEAPLPKYTRHAHLERARKRILFTTGARVNELREITSNDLIGVIDEGRLKLVLQCHCEGYGNCWPRGDEEAYS